jgi:hypothetical protein
MLDEVANFWSGIPLRQWQMLPLFALRRSRCQRPEKISQLGPWLPKFIHLDKGSLSAESVTRRKNIHT